MRACPATALFLGAALALTQPLPPPVPPILVVHDHHVESSIAQGALFTLHVGPAFGSLPEQEDRGFPLWTEAGNVSLRVTVAQITVPVFIISTSGSELVAMLPSSAPLGDGELVLTLGGRTASVRIRVVARRFHLYQQTAGVSWWPQLRARASNVDAGGNRSTNTLLNPVRPGETLLLWGTGLGPVTGDESSGPLPGDIAAGGIEVIAGNQPAKVLYAGRSGCCAGLDQIAFEVPGGIEGCSVPVWVRFPDTEESDAGLVAIAAAGRCADPHVAPYLIEKLDAEGGFGLGFVSLSHGMASFAFGPYFAPIPGTCRPGGVPIGHIEQSQWEMDRFGVGPVLNVSTPQGTERWSNLVFAGGGIYYSEYYPSRYLREPHLPLAGTYSVDNGDGYRAFGPFRATFEIAPFSFEWTNRDALEKVNRSAGIEVTWNAGDVDSAYVKIFGGLSGPGFIGSFTCTEHSSKGRFVVPPYVWGGGTADVQRVELEVGVQFDGPGLQFEAPGLDLAFASYHSSTRKTIVVQ